MLWCDFQDNRFHVSRTSAVTGLNVKSAILTFLFFDLFHLLGIKDNVHGHDFAAYHGLMADLLLKSGHEHLSLDVQSRGFESELGIGGLLGGKVINVHMIRKVSKILWSAVVHLSEDSGPEVPNCFRGPDDPEVGVESQELVFEDLYLVRSSNSKSLRLLYHLKMSHRRYSLGLFCDAGRLF